MQSTLALQITNHRPWDGTASADYISLWNDDAAVLLESLDLVQRTASEIIAATTPDKTPPPEGGG